MEVLRNGRILQKQSNESLIFYFKTPFRIFTVLLYKFFKFSISFVRKSGVRLVVTWETLQGISKIFYSKLILYWCKINHKINQIVECSSFSVAKSLCVISAKLFSADNFYLNMLARILLHETAVPMSNSFCSSRNMPNFYFGGI